MITFVQIEGVQCLKNAFLVERSLQQKGDCKKKI